MKTLNSLKFHAVAATLLGAVLFSACQPQTDTQTQAPAASTPAALTQAQAVSICSTLAVARNTPDFNSMALVLAENVVSNDPFSPTPMTSLEQLKQFILGQQASFPDFTVRYDDIAVSGDRIFAQWTASGTHNGSFFDLAPTGKRVTLSGIAVMTVADGKVTMQTNYFDLLTVARQLGARLVADPDAI